MACDIVISAICRLEFQRPEHHWPGSTVPHYLPTSDPTIPSYPTLLRPGRLPANKRRWSNVDLMLGRWTNIKSTLDQHLVFAGLQRIISLIQRMLYNLLANPQSRYKVSCAVSPTNIGITEDLCHEQRNNSISTAPSQLITPPTREAAPEHKTYTQCRINVGPPSASLV